MSQRSSIATGREFIDRKAPIALNLCSTNTYGEGLFEVISIFVFQQN